MTEGQEGKIVELRLFCLYDADADEVYPDPVNATRPFCTPYLQKAQLLRHFKRLDTYQIYRVDELLNSLVHNPPPNYSQRDGRWADVKLGFSTTTTLGTYGCLVTAVAMMVSHAYRAEITPPMANEALKRVDAFVGPNRNLMKFASVVDAYPKLEMAGFERFTNVPADVDMISHKLPLGVYSIIQVDFDPSDVDLDEHWVLVIGSPVEGVFFINDPWFGKTYELPPAYCKPGWDAARAIYTIAQYRYMGE